MAPHYINDLRASVRDARQILSYYRNGPLGDIPAANGKIMEEALRKVLTHKTKAPVGTSGLVDLAVPSWDTGFQVKTYRTKSNKLIFARSDKPTKEARIEDIKARVLESLSATNTKNLAMMNIDIMNPYFTLHKLADIKEDGTVQTYGTFLQPTHVNVTEAQTHFNIQKDGLELIHEEHPSPDLMVTPIESA